MSKVNLKDNIWIEGFDKLPIIWELPNHILIDSIEWHGKTSEIPEELAKECIQKILPYTSKLYGKDMFCDYSKKEIGCELALESIQSACPEEYCIIYKKY